MMRDEISESQIDISGKDVGWKSSEILSRYSPKVGGWGAAKRLVFPTSRLRSMLVLRFDRLNDRDVEVSEAEVPNIRLASTIRIGGDTGAMQIQLQMLNYTITTKVVADAY